MKLGDSKCVARGLLRTPQQGWTNLLGAHIQRYLLDRRVGLVVVSDGGWRFDDDLEFRQDKLTNFEFLVEPLRAFVFSDDPPDTLQSFNRSEMDQNCNSIVN